MIVGTIVGMILGMDLANQPIHGYPSSPKQIPGAVVHGGLLTAPAFGEHHCAVLKKKGRPFDQAAPYSERSHYTAARTLWKLEVTASNV
jgi:hypothetical protein